MQMGLSCGFTPADVLIALLQAPLGRAERQRPHPSVPGTFHQVANLRPAQRTLAPIVPPLHEGVPDSRSLAVAAGDGNEVDLAQFLHSAPKLGSLAPGISRGLRTRPLETALFGRGQDDEALAMQLQECFATADLLESTVRSSPVQPLTYAPRQSAPRQKEIGPKDRFDLGEGHRIEFPATNPPPPCIASSTLSVKCVRGSAFSWRSSGSPTTWSPLFNGPVSPSIGKV